jgi:hypothetical protein
LITPVPEVELGDPPVYHDLLLHLGGEVEHGKGEEAFLPDGPELVELRREEPRESTLEDLLEPFFLLCPLWVGP